MKDKVRFKLPSVPDSLNNFFVVGCFFQAVILIMFGCYTTYPKTAEDANGIGTAKDFEGYDVTQYAVLMDVMVMIFVGFSILFCLLPRYGWAGISCAMLVGAMTFEWSIVCKGLITSAENGWREEDDTSIGAIEVNIDLFAEAIFAAASVLIASAGVLGRTSLEQLIVMMFFMVPSYAFNHWVVIEKIGASDTGGTIFIHAFGAFFGFACSWVLGHDESHKMKRRFDEAGNYNTNVFALIGTIFLWVYYPSFNAYGMTGIQKFRATFNTQLALIAAAVTSIIMSDMTKDSKKNMMIHMQTGILAGGVTTGCLADHPIEPYGALLLGTMGAITCVLGIKYITPFMDEKLNIHDTCDCMALHGIPAFVSVFASCISYGIRKNYSSKSCFVTVEQSDGNGGTFTVANPDYNLDICDNYYRPAKDDNQIGKQIGAIFACAGMALGFGLPTGAIMGMWTRDDHWYDVDASLMKED